MTDPGEPTGLILNIQRLSTEDGPGIRSTVFFKQCPLACQWCHNPESISGRPELQWFPTRCIDCRSCEKACVRGCITFGPEGQRIDRADCDGCGTCALECPSNALQLLGRHVGAAALAAELIKDRAFYESSGGGVTLSGGEPLAQAAFVSAVLHVLKEQGILTALDTCGFAPADSLERLLPDLDLVLYDLKAIDPASHRAFTGQTNELILRNLMSLQAACRKNGDRPRLWIRTPLIPGATATAENIRAIGSFLAEHLDGTMERWELCAFNNLCRDQYKRLGILWAYAETPLMSRGELQECADQARSSGIDPDLVTVSGAARME
ncbi:MAG: glycyl-radical enzyme activating protein [Spirochaetia bacterium]|jgi:pyruvate formate lyase activating enzyme